MTDNDHSPLFARRFAAIACVCALLSAPAAHHPAARAQSVGSAASPTVPQDAAEAANRALKLGPAATATALHIVLPPPDAAESRKSDAEPNRNRPLRIGFPRSMPSEYRGDLSPEIDWFPLDDGAIAGTVLLTSPGARALRASLRAELGPEGEIRVFTPNADRQVAEGYSDRTRERRALPVITRAEFHEGGAPEILWTPTVEGDTLGMEITLPCGEALSAFSLRIERVSHIYVSMGSIDRVINETAVHVANFRQATAPREGSYSIPFVTRASNTQREGFVRVINNSDRAGRVSITAIDDDGRSYGPVSLSLGATIAITCRSSIREGTGTSEAVCA